MCDLFPLLFSHAVNTEQSVTQVLADGLGAHLAPRLSCRAGEELHQLTALLDRVTLRDDVDQRLSPLLSDASSLRSGAVYTKLVQTSGSPPPPFVKFVWKNRGPPRVQFFVWLLVQGRIQFRANLVMKNILEDASCELCGQVEDCDHIVFRCPFAASIWSSLGADTTSSFVQSLRTIHRRAMVPAQHYDNFLLLC